MQKNELAKGVTLLEDKMTDCVTCQYGKQIRKPFPHTTWKAKNTSLLS